MDVCVYKIYKEHSKGANFEKYDEYIYESGKFAHCNVKFDCMS